MCSIINKLNNGIITPLHFKIYNISISTSSGKMIREKISIENNDLICSTQSNGTLQIYPKKNIAAQLN